MDPEILTLHNAVALRTAVRRWSKENGGGYPSYPAATNSLDHTLVDLLPGGIPLRNAFAGTRSEPRIAPAESPGQVSYSWIAKIGEDPTYRIEAYGKNLPLWSWEPRMN